MTDDQLDALVRLNHPEPDFPASFQREVWARIARASSDSRPWERVGGWLMRPIPSVLMVLAMVVLGAGAGALTARKDSTDLHHAYLASIDPLHPFQPRELP